MNLPTVEEIHEVLVKCDPLQAMYGRWPYSPYVWASEGIHRQLALYVGGAHTDGDIYCNLRTMLELWLKAWLVCGPQTGAAP